MSATAFKVCRRWYHVLTMCINILRVHYPLFPFLCSCLSFLHFMPQPASKPTGLPKPASSSGHRSGVLIEAQSLIICHSGPLGFRYSLYSLCSPPLLPALYWKSTATRHQALTSTPAISPSHGIQHLLSTCWGSHWPGRICHTYACTAACSQTIHLGVLTLCRHQYTVPGRAAFEPHAVHSRRQGQLYAA